MERYGYVQMVPQNFRAYNRGDMYFPSGSRNHAPIHTALYATPAHVGKAMNVHAIPVLYTQPKANDRTRGAIGMRTPDIKGSALK